VLKEHNQQFALDPKATALVIIDMQYASACRTTGLGRWLAEQGRSDEGRYRFDRLEQLVVPSIVRLLSFFREAELPVFFVTLGGRLPGCRDLVPRLRSIESAIGNIEGSREFEILDEIAPQPGELVIPKLSTSAFTSSNLEAHLRHLEIPSLVFCGVSTGQCVDLTARDAADRAYRCVIVEDAVAEDSPEYHESTLDKFGRLWGRVLSSDEVITELRTLRSPDARLGSAR
jgi:nicotinamidase-related amidase